MVNPHAIPHLAAHLSVDEGESTPSIGSNDKWGEFCWLARVARVVTLAYPELTVSPSFLGRLGTTVPAPAEIPLPLAAGMARILTLVNEVQHALDACALATWEQLLSLLGPQHEAFRIHQSRNCLPWITAVSLSKTWAP